MNGESWLFGTVVLHLLHDSVSVSEENALENFVAYYKSTLQIVESRGQKKLPALLSKMPGAGISEVWTDHSGNQFQVRGQSAEFGGRAQFEFGPLVHIKRLVQAVGLDTQQVGIPTPLV